MTNLENGQWMFTFSWDGDKPYSFMTTLSNGIITINDSPYLGTYTTLDGSNQIALAIADLTQHSITSFVGNYNGYIMGGQMTAEGKAIHRGVWCAQHSLVLEAPKGTFGIGE